MKISSKTSTLILAIAALFCVFANPHIAAADDEICVAIVNPCDDQGNPLPPYDTADGPCAEKFRRQCASLKANLVADDLIQCEKDSDLLEEKYKKKIKSLQRKLRAAHTR